MHEFATFLSGLDWPVILTVLVGGWYLRRDMRKEIKEVKDEIKDIHKEFKFINIRLSRAEGTLYGKDIYKETKENT